MADQGEDEITLISKAALETGNGMIARTKGAPDHGTINVSAAHFRIIGQMLIRLSQNTSSVCGPACMGRPVDGLRFWVPMDQVAAERKRLQEMEAHLRSLDQPIIETGYFMN